MHPSRELSNQRVVLETTGVGSESGLMGCSPNDSPRLTPNTWSWSTWGRIGEQSHRALSREDGEEGRGALSSNYSSSEAQVAAIWIPLQKLPLLCADFGKKQTHF